MWPFNKKRIKVCQSGILNEFTDWHSHLLPGVDDGVSKADESLAILELMAESGVKEIHFTPHVMEDVPNRPADLRTGYESFVSSYNGSVRISLGAENMLDSLFAERLAANDLLPLSADHILVETSFINPPMDFHGLLRQIESVGFYPVLAHPERYRYMETDDYKNLQDMGVRFQLNMTSLAGFYGKTAQDKARFLLEKGSYTLAGLDIHSLNQFRTFLESDIDVKDVRLLEPLLERNII